MKFYNSIGVEILDCLVSDSSYRYRKILSDNSLTIDLEVPEHFSPQIGMYCEFQGSNYYLLDNKSITKNGNRNFAYTLVLRGVEFTANKYKLKAVDGRVKFPMTAKLSDFADLIVYNLNLRDSGWSVGNVAETSEKTIAFNLIYILDAVKLISDTFKTEFEFVGKTLNFGRVEYYKSDPLNMSIRDGFKVGIKMETDQRPVEILYIQGTERNIDFSTYGSKELLLPRSQILTYEGRQYISSADGRSIRRFNKAIVTGQEDSIDLSEIYPAREGTINTVIAVDAETHKYDFTDFSIPEDLNYNNYMIAGETMTVVFQTGMLAGREFEISKYTHSERRFEIVPATLDGIDMPGGYYLPAAADKYKIFGVQLPTAYICNNSTQTGASWDVFREAAKYFYEHEDDIFTLVCPVDSKWTTEKWLEVGGKIKPGAYIHLFDTDLAGPTGLDIRIIGMKDNVNNPKKIELDLSNGIIGISTGDRIKQPDPIPVTIDDKTKEGKRFTQRRFSDAQRTIALLQEAIDGFSDPINPISIMTMAILVGSESLQFRFVTSKTAPVVESHTFTYNSLTKSLATASGIIQHMSLGINTIKKTHSASEYMFWDVAAYESPALTESAKAYYFYARCNKANTNAVFLLSETPLPFQTDVDYYYLLVGTLGEEIDGARSFVTVYGFTEILPGRITTDKIVSPTGETYIDLTAGDGKGEIGGVFKFLAGSSGLSNITEFGLLVQAVVDLSFLTDAIEGSTEIAGGLLLTNLLMLRGTDNVVRAGMSGLANDNVFLFADSSNAYQKALQGIAQFILKKDGTAKLGIMKIGADTVGLFSSGVEKQQFRTGDIPALTDLVSTLDTTINYTGGSDTYSGLKQDDFGMSDALTVSSIDSFTLTVTGSILARCANDQDTPIPNSFVQITLKLYKESGGSYVFDRDIDTVAVMSDSVGNTQESKTLNAVINLPAGTYKLQAEYMINTAETDEGYVEATGISMRARGAAANECMIFGANGFVRITDGTNFDYFGDDAAVFSRGEDKYVKVTSTGIEVKGAFNAPGLLAAGSVSSAGGLNNSFGKVTDSEKSSTGIYVITHTIGHSLYAVNLTLYNSGAQVTAVVTSKSDTSFSVRIVNPSNNSLTDSAFDFSCYGTN